MKWLRYVGRGFAVVSLLGVTLPKIMSDGKIEAREVFDFFTQTAKICNWDVTLDVPEAMLKVEITGKVS